MVARAALGCLALLPSEKVEAGYGASKGGSHLLKGQRALI
jgi:hypothetical protein